MTCQCASAITAEMTDWVRIGGSNSGCCGNSGHTYGFHRAANEIPATDYSRRRDPAGPNAPANWNWAAAGDFGHGGNPALRARHAALLGRLMNNDPALSMICEFIGQPWAGKPVYYWCRWAGNSTLKRYTGSGHDTWSHISWWRSRADQRPHLWTSAGSSSIVTPASKPEVSTGPGYPGYVMGYNPNKADGNVSTWQRRMKDRGWTIGVDGVFGDETLRVVKAFQRDKDLGVDGLIGLNTWVAAWSTPVT